MEKSEHKSNIIIKKEFIPASNIYRLPSPPNTTHPGVSVPNTVTTSQIGIVKNVPISHPLEPTKKSEIKPNEPIEANKMSDSLSKSDVKLDVKLTDKAISELTFQDISVNLRLISKIEVGNKLSSNDKYINIDTSYFPSLTRWFRGINRNTNLEFINLILTRAFYLNDSILVDKELEYSQVIFNLTNDFRNAINGLLNLKQTYCNDKLIQSELDVLIENIRNKIESNSKKLNFSQ